MAQSMLIYRYAMIMISQFLKSKFNLCINTLCLICIYLRFVNSVDNHTDNVADDIRGNVILVRSLPCFELWYECSFFVCVQVYYFCYCVSDYKNDDDEHDDDNNKCDDDNDKRNNDQKNDCFL